ncbi:protein diaphanous [Anaeramoeba flamelloides]|uniref:Protein diaphanous n=1 Tax=Anaeramoeba flamelloides TaxID=1746091 RepID=A0ABQ8Y4P8_9EUKA|nr:protein diaphanous [Anaeramoeba flamelloides]
MSEKKKLEKLKRQKRGNTRSPNRRNPRSKQNDGRSSNSSQNNRRRWGKLMSLNAKHPNADLINQKNFIGRHHKCLISFSSMELSNIHFQIWLMPPQKTNSTNPNSSESKPMVFIQDLSTNGTYLNGKLIGKKKQKRLKNGDEITLLTPHYDNSEDSKTIGYVFQDYSLQLFQKALEKKKKNFQQTVPNNSVKQKSRVLEGDRGIIQTPQKFVDQLRYHLIPNVLATLYKVIQLQTSSWITEFFELGGLDLLIESLRFRIEKSRRNQTDRSIETHIVQCLKLLMDKKVGLESIVKHPKALETLALSLYNDNVPSKCHALKILTVPLVVNQESYDKVLAGFSQAVEYGFERIRFQRLVRTFELIDDLKYRQRLMLLINFIIVTPEDVMIRMQMRREFIACGLEKYFDDVLYPMQEIKITRQLRFFINEKEKDEELVQLGKIDLTDPKSLIQAIVQQTQGSDEYQNMLKVLQGLLTIQHDENSKQKWNAVQNLVQKSAIREKLDNEGNQEKDGNIQNQVIVELERQKISSLEEQVQKLAHQVIDLEKTNKNLLKGIKTGGNNGLQGGEEEEEEGDDFSRFDDNIKTNKVSIGSPMLGSSSLSTNEKKVDNENEETKKLKGSGGGTIPPPPMIGGGLPPPPDLRKQKWKDEQENEGNNGGGGIPPPPMGGGGGGIPPPPMGGGGGVPPPPMGGGGIGGMPPPPPMGGGGIGGMPPPPSFGKKRGLFGKKKPNVKMKQLFWSKMNKKQVDKTIWSDVSKFITSQNLQANVKNLEEHFCARRKLTKKEKKVIDEEKKERAKKKKAESIKLIEPSKAQTVEMILKRWKYSHDEVKEAILKMDDQKFDIDKLKTLIKIMPDETQQETVNSFSGDVKRLGEVEKFYRLMGTIPSLKKRLAAFEFKLEFHVSLKDVHQDIEQIIEASKSISESEGMRQIFALILISGNYMNMGTSRGNCQGFKLDFLVRLASTKSIDNKMSLIQFCCLEAERLGLAKVISLPEDLFGLRKVIGKPIEMIQAEANQIKNRIEENDEFLKSFKKSKGVFYKSLFNFLKNTRKQMKSLGSLMDKMEKEYKRALSMFGIGEQDKMVSTEYFSLVHNFVLEVEQGTKANIKERELQEKKIKDEKRKIAQEKRREELKKKKKDNQQQGEIQIKTPKKSSKSSSRSSNSARKNNFKNIYGTIKQGRLIRKDSKQDLNLMNFMQQAKLARSSLRPINSTLEGIQEKKN